jgi:cytochrome b561
MQPKTILWRNTSAEWGWISKLLHWVMAVLVVCQLALGWCAVTWPLSPFKLHLFIWHKTIGIVMLALIIIRLGWKLTNNTPSLPPTMPIWEQKLAHTSHGLLYVLMVFMPLSGWIINSAANMPFRFLGLALPAIVAPNPTLETWAKAAHFWFVMILVILLCLHLAAALRHHFVKHDTILKRMLF